MQTSNSCHRLIANAARIAALACLSPLLAFAATKETPATVPASPAPPTPSLSAADVQALEEQLKTTPNNQTVRGQLLEHYSRAQFRSRENREARQRHVLWVIEHDPETDLRGPLIGLNKTLDGDAYERGAELWLEHVKAQPDKIVFLDRAAEYLLLSDRDRAEDLLLKAEGLEPANARWPERLAQLYALSAMKRDGVDLESARKALTAQERARRKATDAYPYLGNLAKFAFIAGEMEKARTYATELLQAATAHAWDWSYGNAVHDGNAVLGRVALREGKLDEAKARLLAAGRSPGSPQLNSFGPNMSLAGELAERGEKETVLVYFNLCRVFWKMGQSRLDTWAAAVAEGRPPDFGPNLRY